MKGALLAALLVAAMPAPAWSVEVSVRPIERFRALSDLERFGDVRFLGGVELAADDPRFSGLSGLVLSPDGSRATFVSDDGFLLSATIARRGDRIVGLGDVGVAELDDPRQGKDGGDAEDLAPLPGVAGEAPRFAIAFERQGSPVRIVELGRDGRSRVVERRTFEGRARLRNNGGIEAIALAPDLPGLPAAGRLVAIAERSYRGGDETSAPGFILGLGAFQVRRSGGYAVTAARFLANGDLLLLERLFTPAKGLGMRLRRVNGADIRPGATVEGKVVLAAEGLFFRIDNMEGMDVWTDAAGRTRLTLVSDDNRSIFQRTLILEFELLDGAIPAEVRS